MNRTGPIVLIEDDPDDIEIIKTAVQMVTVPNEIVVFPGSSGVFRYLTDPLVDPLLVISDVNLPGVHGVDLYLQLNADTAFANKNIPYIFLSTSPEHFPRASEVNKCGYFVKPRDYFDYVSIVQRIVLYWMGAQSI